MSHRRHAANAIKEFLRPSSRGIVAVPIEPRNELQPFGGLQAHTVNVTQVDNGRNQRLGLSDLKLVGLLGRVDVDNVDAIADISSSGVGFAVVALAKERRKVILNASASSDFTGKFCTDVSTQWVYNTYSNGYTLARTLTEKGLNTWFLVTVDYVFGHSFSTDVRKGVKDAGGTVLGEVRHPLNTSDFSSFLLQAQSSGAKVIALLSAGGDMLNATKQANEFQIGK